jgi:hypothetical protein
MLNISHTVTTASLSSCYNRIFICIGSVGNKGLKGEPGPKGPAGRLLDSDCLCSLSKYNVKFLH